MQRQAVRFAVGLGAATVVSLGLLTAEALVNHEWVQYYLVWNLFLAWLPLVLAYLLVRVLQRKLWSSWEALLLTLGWVVFLPNSFYIISDFIHLDDLADNELLFGLVITAAFAFSGVCLGLTSVYLVHRQLVRRIPERLAMGLIGLTLLIASSAIYIGRDLRWNSWDVLVNPFGIIFDVSERALHPSQYPTALSVILPFFALISLMYFLTWYFADLLTQKTHDSHP